MIAVSKGDLGRGNSIIRFQAIRYFLTELHPNIISQIIGNGTPNEKSAYGMKMTYLSMRNGFYLSDIGIVGVYVKYGVIFVTITIFLYIKILFRGMHKDIRYIKYYILLLIVTSFTDYHPFQTNEGVIVLASLLYIIDYYDNHIIQNSSNNKNVFSFL